MRDLFKRMSSYIKTLDPRTKFLIGILFILLGILALVTPLTPGAWLIFVGLELIGIRIIAWRRFLDWLTRRKGDKDENA